MEGQVKLGIDCHGCRAQCAEAKVPAPCDTEQGCPYSPSPGDKSENGCGLAPENETALWLYPRWKNFGNLAIELADMELHPWEADLLLDKLMLIDEYVPWIQKKHAEREKAKEKVRGRRRRRK